MRGISQLDTSSSSSGGLHSHGRLDAACPSPARAVPVQEEDIYLYGAYTNNQGRSGGIAPISSCLVGSHRGFHPTASALVSAGLHNQPVPQDWSLPELPSSVSRAELLPSAGNAYTDLGSLQKRLAAVATVAVRLQLRMRRVPLAWSDFYSQGRRHPLLGCSAPCSLFISGLVSLILIF